MLHAATLIYLSAREEIATHINEHKNWLVRGINEGKIIFAGPLSKGNGGYILFHDDSEDSVNAFLKEDPFIKYNLVSVDLISIEAALTTKDFPKKWAEKAHVI